MRAWFKAWAKQRRDKNCARHKHYWNANRIQHQRSMEIMRCTNCGVQYLVWKK